VGGRREKRKRTKKNSSGKPTRDTFCSKEWAVIRGKEKKEEVPSTTTEKGKGWRRLTIIAGDNQTIKEGRKGS